MEQASPLTSLDAAFPPKRPQRSTNAHEWPAVSMPSPAPSIPSSHDRYSMTNVLGHPFPTPPASACDQKPSPSTRPLLVPRASDDVTPVPSGHGPGLSGSAGNQGLDHSPISPDSSPRLHDAISAKVRELTERRRVQGLAAKKTYRHRREQESRKKMLEERGCASDTELEDPSPAALWDAEIAVAHPKPVSQFKRLAFLDLEDDFLLDRPYDDSRLTPTSDEATSADDSDARAQDAVLPSECKSASVSLLLSKPAIGFRDEHPLQPEHTPAPEPTAITTATSLALINLHESSESLSVTSMSCDYDTAASEDEGGLSSRAERKRILLERLMHYFHSIFSACPPQTRVHAGNDGASPRYNGDSSTATANQLTANRDGTARDQREVRKRRPEDEDGDDEGDDTSKKRPRRHVDDAEETPMRLACPYFKKNPRRYRLSRSCPGPGWSTVHRVKEHLYRVHRLPIHCLYCHEKFDSDKSLQLHLRADQACKALDLPPMEGVDAGQEKLLRSRKKAHKDWTEADKWRDAYRILFPADDPANTPSPYYEYEQGAEAEQCTSPSEIARYEQYLRRELPNQVRQALEARIDEALNPIEETLRDQIVEIVRDSQLHLFERYKSSRSQASQEQTAIENTPPEDEVPTPDQQDGAGPSLHMLDDELQLYRPEPYFDPQLDDLNGDFFNFLQVQLCQDWDDSGYGSRSVTETLSQDKDKERADF